MNRKGYVSVEVIIVAGLVLAAGLAILANFIRTGGQAGRDALSAMETAVSDATTAE
jgi:hypothetical protein